MTTGRIFFFAGTFLLALVLFLPLQMATSMVGLAGAGVTARNALGTIWSGTLIEGRMGPVSLGDVRVGLKPLSLLSGSPMVDMQTAFGRGSVGASRSSFALENVSAKLRAGGAFAPIPLDGLDLDAASIKFSGTRCTRADGRVRATFSGDVGGLSLAQGLSGTARCEGNVLLLPLVSQSAMERLNLYIQSDGSYRAEFLVRSTDAALAAKLGSAGFVPAPGGFVLRLAGKL